MHFATTWVFTAVSSDCIGSLCSLAVKEKLMSRTLSSH